MLTDEVKQRLIAVLSELVARHQRARAQLTDEDRIKELELKVTEVCCPIIVISLVRTASRIS